MKIILKKLNFIFIIIFLVINGCNYNRILEHIIPKEESDFAKNILSNLKAHNYTEVKRNLNPQILTDDVDSNLVKASKLFPTGNILSIKPIGYRNFISGRDYQATLSFEYQCTNGWAVASITLSKNNNSFLINWIKINQFKKSQEEINAFSFSHKSFGHYLFLLFAILIILFEAITIITLIKTKVASKKWLWFIFVLFGFCGITLNWTSGEIGFQLLTLRILSVGIISSSPYSPWFLSISFPIGAIIFWFKRKSLSINFSEQNKIKNNETTIDESWECPKCKEKNPNNIYKCSKCGYTVI